MKAICYNKPKFIFLSLKRNIIPLIFCAFTIFLVLFSNKNLVAAKSGLLLWANNVVPALLPFFIATELLSYTNIVEKIGKILNPIMRPIFNIPGCGAYAFIMGIISGYPIGAKIVTNFRENGLCTKEEAERMLAFTNNSGPLFIIGTVGITLFGNSLIGILLFITHLLACISVGICFRFWKSKKFYEDKNVKKFNKSQNLYAKNSNTVHLSNLGEVLSKSIMSAINTVVMIGGFVVLFSVILSILNSSHIIAFIAQTFNPILKIFGINDFRFATAFISGIIELTNGASLICAIPCKSISINIILCAFLLGFGGISILFQVFSITSKSDVSIKPYIIGKILQAIFATIYTIFFVNFFPIFNLNL